MKLRLLSLVLMVSLIMPLTGAQDDNTGTTEALTQDEDVTETITKANKAIGDIVKDRSRNAVSCWFCKWYKYRDWVYVPIYISSSYSSSQKDIIRSALRSIQDQTCVWFYEISWWSTHYQHHLYIYSGSGCWSYIGRKYWMRRQRVSLSKNGCVTTSIVQHEILHALGFSHEHSRSDRDDYITVLTENIQPGLEGNFLKYRTNNLERPYDFKSVMQYSNFAFSKNGKPTLLSRSDPNFRFGFASKVSANDLLRVNRYYKCKTHLRRRRDLAQDQA